MEDDFDTGIARAADDRPRGVSKAKLADVDLGSKLSIFHRPDRNSPMVPLEPSFPRELAKIFCDRIYTQMERNNSHSFVITGGDQAAYKQIFAWIKSCSETQSIEKFPDIPEPEHDPFTATINVILAGEFLSIPAGSLSFHLKKRLNGCARKHLMPFSQVRELYNVHSQAYKLGLKDIACASIFNAWWDARLDENETPVEMEDMSEMRSDIEELDTDLHQACKVKEDEVRKKWEEKRAKAKAERCGGGNEGDNPVTAVNAEVADDWDNTGNTVTIATSGDWDSSAGGLTHATSPVSGTWDASGATHAAADTLDEWTNVGHKSAEDEWTKVDANTAAADTWADEMNDHPQVVSYAVAAPNQW